MAATDAAFRVLKEEIEGVPRPLRSQSDRLCLGEKGCDKRR